MSNIELELQFSRTKAVLKVEKRKCMDAPTQAPLLALLPFPPLPDPDSPIGGQTSPPFCPYSPLPFSSPFPSPPLPFPSLPLELGPLKYSKRVWGAVRSPSGVWDRAPAEIEFGAF